MGYIVKVLVLLVAVSGSSAYAGSTPKIDYDNNNIYVRVAASKQLIASKTQEMSALTVRLMQEKIVDMLASGVMPVELDVDTIGQIKDSSEELEEFITLAQAYNETDSGSSDIQDVQELIPSAFMVTLGLKASLSLGLSGGGSLTVGLVVMPMTEYVIPRRPDLSDSDLNSLTLEDIEKLIANSVTERLTATWAIIGWPNVDLGVGAGATPGAVRLGAGLIWGPLQSAKDFKGLVGGVSGNATLGVGLNFKVGIVHNGDLPGIAQMKYVLIGAEMGASAEATARVNASVIITDEGLLKMFTGDLELSGEEVIEEYQRNQEEAIRNGADPIKFYFD